MTATAAVPRTVSRVKDRRLDLLGDRHRPGPSHRLTGQFGPPRRLHARRHLAPHGQQRTTVPTSVLRDMRSARSSE